MDPELCSLRSPRIVPFDPVPFARFTALLAVHTVHPVELPTSVHVKQVKLDQRPNWPNNHVSLAFLSSSVHCPVLALLALCSHALGTPCNIQPVNMCNRSY